MEASAQMIVRGLVQGVGFRYFVYNHATKLKLTGHVSNLYDGNVEIVAAGERSMIEELLKQVRIGPRAAQVQDVMIKWMKPDQQYHQFDIR